MPVATKGTSPFLLAVARRNLGISESPKGSNCQQYSKSRGRPCEAWCQDFAGSVAVAAGVNIFGGEKTGYTPTAAENYRRAGRYGKTPRVGAQVFFYHESMGRIAHTGWVESVSPDGKTFISIEGNSNADGSRSGGTVCRVNRKNDRYTTFGYPIYKTPSKTAPTTTAKPKPGAETTTKKGAVPPSPPTLRRGNRGQYVLDLQNRLNKLGKRVDKDSVFGDQTFKALVALQKSWWPKEKAAWDGVCGQRTWSELYKLT